MLLELSSDDSVGGSHQEGQSDYSITQREIRHRIKKRVIVNCEVTLRGLQFPCQTLDSLLKGRRT